MTTPDEAVRLGECPQCGDLILVARIAGLVYRLARWSVPKAAATVLDRYGVTVIRLVRTGAAVYATEADLASTSTHPLATTHVCGVDPSRR